MAPQYLRPFEAFQQGYRAGFKYYVRQESERLIHYLLGKTEDKSTARDLADSVFKFCFRNPGLFRDETHFRDSLTEIGKGFYEGFLLGQKGQAGHSDPFRPLEKECSVYDDSELARVEVLDRLRHSFRRLTPLRRRIIVFYFRRKMSTRQIAGKLGRATQTVLNNKSKALDQLKKDFGPAWDKIFPLLYS